jgi:hypothetical protein
MRRATTWMVMLGTAAALAACGGATPAGEGSGTSPSGTEPPAGLGVASSADAVLRLELRASQTTYAPGEPLELEAFLVNSGSGPAVVLGRATHVDLGIDATNEAGEFITTLLPPEPPLPPTTDDLEVLEAGDELRFDDWEMLQRVGEQIAAGNGRTGRFTVRAFYHAGAPTTPSLLELDPAAWVGSLTSEPLVVEVR